MDGQVFVEDARGEYGKDGRLLAGVMQKRKKWSRQCLIMLIIKVQEAGSILSHDIVRIAASVLTGRAHGVVVVSKVMVSVMVIVIVRVVFLP